MKGTRSEQLTDSRAKAVEIYDPLDGIEPALKEWLLHKDLTHFSKEHFARVCARWASGLRRSINHTRMRGLPFKPSERKLPPAPRDSIFKKFDEDLLNCFLAGDSSSCTSFTHIGTVLGFTFEQACCALAIWEGWAKQMRSHVRNNPIPEDLDRRPLVEKVELN
ncbi:MAG: hypothetical protein HY043_22750 [Verrucomicrobia bacterium]|nr:hypothetical protein [Verrucomicrobiota bacterium]